MRVWKRNGVSAPHKPLLILYALGKLLNGESRLIPFSEVDEVLGNLLKEFGPGGSRKGTEFPFWRLQNDRVWEIPAAHKVRETSKGDAVRSDLIRFDVTGGIVKGIARRIRKDSILMGEIIRNILEAHFPSPVHERILEAVGIEPTLVGNYRQEKPTAVREGTDEEQENYQAREMRQATSIRENADRVKYEALVVQLKERFPLLTNLVGKFGKDFPSERIPWVYGLLLSAATSHDRGACCLVLDKTPGTTAIAAVLLALITLQKEFPELAENYARTALSVGQRVKVKPSNHVYEYDGPWIEHPGEFRLKVQGERSWRSFPMSDVLRLELTDRFRPKGKITSKLGAFERSQLDDLLDFDTCGNNSLFRNTVLLHMAQARFSKALDEVALAQGEFEPLDRLSTFFPWGSVGTEGELKPNDDYQVIGEPIIAVTKVPEDLAFASATAEEGTKIVLADGARGLARDLQAFDDIAEQQRIVILAASEEVEALELLKDHGCPIWYLSPEEVLIGESIPEQRERKSLVGSTMRAALTRWRASIEVVSCHHNLLQSVAENLEQAETLVSDNDESDEVNDIFASLYGVLLECSECCFGAGEDTEAKLQTARELVRRYGRWLPPEFTTEIDAAVQGLAQIISGEAGYQEKADTLLNLLRNDNHQDWAVVTRSPRTAEILGRDLNEHGCDVPALPVSAIGPDSEYAGVVVLAWLGGQKFTRLKNMAVTSDIRILAFPFEAGWVSRHQERERKRERSNQMDARTRSIILGIESQFLESTSRQESDSPTAVSELSIPAFRFADRVEERRVKRPAAAGEGEESRKAQLVQFFGDCYTLLTEWAELPRLNNLIENASTSDAGLEHVGVSGLVQGDFVLFRASEDKEFIRQIAEDMIGLEEYERVRNIAGLWRSSLRRLGDSPSEVQQVLVSHGLTRNPATVAGWLQSPYQIGPGNFGDIEVIARAAEDAELSLARKDVEKSITDIRSAHRSAGGRLTQLILSHLGGHLSDLDDQPVLLDLEYGEAWVVQVDTVDFERRNYPAYLVNRLLWAEDLSS